VVFEDFKYYIEPSCFMLWAN